MQQTQSTGLVQTSAFRYTYATTIGVGQNRVTRKYTGRTDLNEDVLVQDNLEYDLGHGSTDNITNAAITFSAKGTKVVALFDGHGGPRTAKYCADNIIRILNEKLGGAAVTNKQSLFLQHQAAQAAMYRANLQQDTNGKEDQEKVLQMTVAANRTRNSAVIEQIAPKDLKRMLQYWDDDDNKQADRGAIMDKITEQLLSCTSSKQSKYTPPADMKSKMENICKLLSEHCSTAEILLLAKASKSVEMAIIFADIIHFRFVQLGQEEAFAKIPLGDFFAYQCLTGAQKNAFKIRLNELGVELHSSRTQVSQAQSSNNSSSSTSSSTMPLSSAIPVFNTSAVSTSTSSTSSTASPRFFDNMQQQQKNTEELDKGSGTSEGSNLMWSSTANEMDEFVDFLQKNTLGIGFPKVDAGPDLGRGSE